MVQSQGVDVYITPYSDITRRYKEYSIPTASPSFTGNSNEVFIEAVDGERFAVVVDLGDDYDAKGGDRLIIRTRFDETVEAWRHSYGPLSEDVPTGSGLKGRCIIEETDRQVDGSLVKCTFAPLKMDENLRMNPEQVAQSVANHGIIVVELWRCKFVKKHRARELVYTQREGDDTPDTRALPKAVVEDNHVSHAVGHIVVGPPSAGKKPRRSRIFKIADPIIFTIHYRSRDALRQLNIIPRGEAYIDAPLKAASKQNAVNLKRKRSGKSGKSVRFDTAVKTVKAVRVTTIEDDILPIKRRKYLSPGTSEKQRISEFLQRFTRGPAATKSVPVTRPLGVLVRNSTTADDPVNRRVFRNQERPTLASAATGSVPISRTLQLFERSSTTVKARVNPTHTAAVAAAAAPIPNSDATKVGLPSINHRNKERKAVEEELEDIELKQRFIKLQQQYLYLEQRKCHRKRKLALLDDDVK